MGVFVFVLGLALIALIWWFHLQAVKKARASESWPTAAGTVRSSTVRETVSRSKGSTRRSYSANITYGYEVAGTAFAGDKVSFGGSPSHNFSGQAQAVCDRYPTGKAVTVRYNPEKPAEGVLESTTPSKSMPIIFTVVIGLITVVCALLL